MREKKFRAWDNEKKVMVLLDRQWICNEYSSICFRSSQKEYQGICEWPVGNEENQIIVQYTGLKDKCGKEIYEGDIIKKVFPYNQNFAIEPIPEFYDQLGSLQEQGSIDYLEVIGNIYENSNLLKK